MEDWVIVKNTHEPIVYDEDFELVQKLMTSRRKAKAGASGYDNIFSGIIKCTTCGYAMRTSSANRRKHPEPIDNMGYYCNNYGTYGKKVCTQHWIEARELHRVVLEDICKHATMALKDDNRLLEDVLGNIDTQSHEDSKRLKREQKQAEKRLVEVDKMFGKLFEDNANSKISERNYLAVSRKYESEQSDLERKIATIKDSLEKECVATQNAEMWVEQMKSYASITELSAPLLNTLIDRITVSEPEVVDGQKFQTVNIFYKFIGCIGFEL